MIFIARNDGVHRTTVRNANLTKNQIGNVQRHNEREKESYVNQDIVPERTPLNVHFIRIHIKSAKELLV